MDNLSGLSWSASPVSNANKPHPPPKPNTLSSNVFANLPIRPSTTSPGPSKFNRTAPQPPPSTAGGGDSFANLVSFGRNKQSTGNLSLQEQQRRLQEQKANEEKERRKKIDALFGGGGSGDAATGFWNSLESGKGAGDSTTAASRAPPVDDDDDDLLAAFNASVPVDNSSHYPPPAPSPVSGSYTPTPRSGTPSSHMQDLISDSGFLGPKSYTPAPRNGTPGSHLQDLMGDSAPNYTQSGSLDPFDIGSLPSRTTPTNNVADDDDILGDLAKPVSELPPRPKPTPPTKPQELEDMPSMNSKTISDPRDPVIAEIMDMGFTAAQAKRALHETDSLDVRTAVGWLLEDAHKRSRPASSQPMPRTGSSQGQRGRRPDEGAPRRRREEGRDEDSTPAWVRDRSREPDGEKDLGALAHEIGGTLFKSANSLWNTGKKKVEKAIAEFQTEGPGSDSGDPNMPKWMRDQQIEASVPTRGRERGNRFHEDDIRPIQRTPQAPEPKLTEEAMMLEAGSGPPPRRKQEMDSSSRSSSATPSGLGLSEKELIQRQRQYNLEQAIRDKERELRERERPKPVSSSIPNSIERNRKITREAVEEDSAGQYVSRNRRRPPPPSATSNTKPATPEPPRGDLLFGGGSTTREQSRNPFQQRNPAPVSAPRRQNPNPTPPPEPRHVIPQRPNIHLSSSAQQISTSARIKGSEAFKRGDYTLALTHYTASLSPLPESHILRIVVLSNRALCNLKLGDPKSALSDCEEILSIIGPGRGDGEIITLDGGNKDMKEYWGKTITRKAEGLEQLEKWVDASATWTLAVESGVGGAVATAGRRRCESALRPKPAISSSSSPRPNPARRPPPPKVVRPHVDAQAVKALRQANAAADRVEDEKLALHDSVETRIGTWKAGKEGNLRALLGSLDTVLWDGAGWKKVGMGDLLMPGKCKVVYMKGISKVHPDKISQDATTEQKMISAAVFSLLNEAWDKFKAENRL
ncbi:auxilin-like clathrin-binding protein required for normal clathrin function [Maublancomyces gigas]|uniref:Auxilin-like clathrin-binding protein required for normal clathrin function n=1 Tax=Discina gigas TaxID=1032678 RepID=A0ABR3GXQ0_9PEZI